ncbi:hypothetical protein DFP72DRAFT_1070632 [Ephemerocybe angulata]|uniref:Uncharacterized protein n=1 Tax=Ephemerocybe angulata TaxID=980116 RepID=A0A8H6HU19_9AGAR|nr:hypothetical protein DFP72DRAFT_1070632 [Tulosesus angulatus]
MPLRALFNPSLYSAPISTAKLVFKAPLAPRAYAKRAQHSSERVPAPHMPQRPIPCCPHPHPSFNSDSTYWHLRRSPQLQGALTDKFHEIEQLYLGNVSYRAHVAG